MKIISNFVGKYYFLSNFSKSPFEYEGHTYPTVEHAYQERKTLCPFRREMIRNAKTAFECARLGRSKDTVLREGWLEGMKGDVMRQLVHAKFLQNPKLAQKLLDTGDALLIEGNYWHDNYFGVCTCQDCHENEQPQNILGKILMDVRKSLNNVIPQYQLEKTKTCDNCGHLGYGGGCGDCVKTPEMNEPSKWIP